MPAIINKLKILGKREENKELIKHSFIALFLRVGGAGIAFLMNIVVARNLGASQAGYFFLAVSITTLISSIGRVGADQTVLRFVGIHAAKNEWAEVHGVMKKMMSWTYLPLLFFTSIICIFAAPISTYIFHKPELQWPLFWTAIIMPFFAGYNVLGMALQGLRKVAFSVTVLKILTPLFLIALVFAFRPKDATYTSVYYAIACILNLLLGYYWWYKSAPKTSAPKNYDTSTLWKSSGPLWLSAIMNQVTIWAGQLIAGIYLNSVDVAQLAVARNITVLITFIMLAVNNVSAPRIASMYQNGEMNKLKNYVRNTTWLMTLVSLPITILVWFFPELIMSLFGKGFTEGYWLLRILALGQFVSVVSGIVGTLLIMSGFEKDLKNIRIFNGVLAIILAFILTPLYGAIGSALSSAIAMALFNLVCVFYVKKRLGFSTLSLLWNFDKTKKDI
ncbi:MAG: flippase [Bacteroidetes bacterium]|nr:flippase [Bacteroidota bacterium]